MFSRLNHAWMAALIFAVPVTEHSESSCPTPPGQPARGPHGRDYATRAYKKLTYTYGSPAQVSRIYLYEPIPKPVVEKALIVFFHGWLAQIIDSRPYEDLMIHLAKKNYRVAYIEYGRVFAGYPRYLDNAVNGFRFILGKLAVRPSELAFIGHSMEGVIAFSLAADPIRLKNAGIPQPRLVIGHDPKGGGTTSPVARFFNLDKLGRIPQGTRVVVGTHLNWSRSAVVGISLGGVIGTHVAAQRPQAIPFLSLVSTPIDYKTLHPPRTAATEEWLRYFSPTYQKQNPLLVKGFLKEAMEVSAEGSRQQRKVFERFDLRDQLRRLSMPALVIHGTEDAIVPVTSAREMQALLPLAELQEFKGMGHLLIAEARTALYEAVAQFGDRLRE